MVTSVRIRVDGTYLNTRRTYLHTPMALACLPLMATLRAREFNIRSPASRSGDTMRNTQGQALDLHPSRAPSPSGCSMHVSPDHQMISWPRPNKCAKVSRSCIRSSFTSTNMFAFWLKQAGSKNNSWQICFPHLFHLCTSLDHGLFMTCPSRSATNFPLDTTLELLCNTQKKFDWSKQPSISSSVSGLEVDCFAKSLRNQGNQNRASWVSTLL